MRRTSCPRLFKAAGQELVITVLTGSKASVGIVTPTEAKTQLNAGSMSTAFFTGIAARIRIPGQSLKAI
jgi:hypothetical protein